MPIIVALIRVVGVFVALLFVVSDAMDIMGIIPYSDAMPPLRQRIFHSLPTLVAAIVLMIPYRFFASGVRFRLLLCALLLLLVGTIGMGGAGVYGYLQGRKSWEIVPASGLIIMIPASNLWALVQMRRQLRSAVQL